MESDSNPGSPEQPLSELNENDVSLQHDHEANGDDNNGDDLFDDGNDEKDLFGDDGDAGDADAPASEGLRQLDDEDLDSGDDEGRNDRQPATQDEMDDDGEGRSVNVMDAQINRHAVPQPSDGELYLLKLPEFLGLDSNPFHFTTFQLPTGGHDQLENPTAPFSASNVATSTVRWRRSPKNTSKLESNARIIRWSDGSLTFQVATNPKHQYQLPAKGLAIAQQDPRKPTPTSVKKARSGHGSSNVAGSDTHTFLSASDDTVGLIRTVGQITTSLNVLPSTNADDDALARLQKSLAAASNRGRNGKEGPNVISITEDPELAKRKAEIAERDKLRAQKRRQAQEERERDRTNRALGRRGLRESGGLTVGELEDDMMGGTSRRTATKSKKKHRRLDLDSDEDDGFGRRKHTREDEYDEDDGFLVGSDEEPELAEEEESEEEEEIDMMEDKTPPRQGGSPKRDAYPENNHHTDVVDRTKRRKVIIDDDDDEE
ncbi:MAG: hypothetical protein M1834_008216 [Cirrosporium novae-zelandiae]|nr:MAG: hypothetical protein M1834_008216 [Cirrosporium novae-zelandiae]